MARRKTRDSDCCSVNFLEYVLYIFNVIFLVSLLKKCDDLVIVSVLKLFLSFLKIYFNDVGEILTFQINLFFA